VASALKAPDRLRCERRYASRPTELPKAALGSFIKHHFNAAQFDDTVQRIALAGDPSRYSDRRKSRGGNEAEIGWWTIFSRIGYPQ